MPGNYDRDQRLITLNTDFDQEPLLTTATIVHFAVSDMLHEQQFSLAGFPDVTDIAVIATGLGVLHGNLQMANSSGSFWDSTVWSSFPQPFLDAKSTSYAFALTAWLREEIEPAWFRDLPAEVKRPMQKSIKYLDKTNDSFFQMSNERQVTLDQPQADWLKCAADQPPSTQVIAVRHLQPDGNLNGEIETQLLEMFHSNNPAILLQCINAGERLKMETSIKAEDPVVAELRTLLEHGNDVIRAKAMCALTRMSQLDEASVEIAGRLLDGNTRHIVFSGVFALGAQESVPENIMPGVNRGFVRALQKCDYEFVGLFAAAFNRWMDDPAAHIRGLLEEDNPEYLEVGLETLQQVQDQMVALG